LWSFRGPERAPGFPGPENRPKIGRPTLRIHIFRSALFPAENGFVRKAAEDVLFLVAARTDRISERACSPHAAALPPPAVVEACCGPVRWSGGVSALSLHACHATRVRAVSGRCSRCRIARPCQSWGRGVGHAVFAAHGRSSSAHVCCTHDSSKGSCMFRDICISGRRCRRLLRPLMAPR